MVLSIIFGIITAFIIIRTITYGVHSIKESGITAGISVFILALCAVITGYIILFTDKGLR
jgi:hypothetical protein